MRGSGTAGAAGAIHRVAPWLHVAGWSRLTRPQLESFGFAVIVCFKAPDEVVPEDIAGLRSLSVFEVDDGVPFPRPVLDAALAALRSTSRSLATCRMGQSRSPSVCVGALILRDGLPARAAIERVARALVPRHAPERGTAFHPALPTLCSVLAYAGHPFSAAEVTAVLHCLGIDVDDP
jgi:hypothetical protein